jgi:hypothetical protein
MPGVPTHRLDGWGNDINLHHHASATAIRSVINGAVAIRRVIANVMDTDRDQPTVSRPPKHGARERSPNELRM